MCLRLGDIFAMETGRFCSKRANIRGGVKGHLAATVPMVLRNPAAAIQKGWPTYQTHISCIRHAAQAT